MPPEILNKLFSINSTLLPVDTSKDLVDSFLAGLVSLISFNAGLPSAAQAMEMLFRFVKNGKKFKSYFADEQVFIRFKPTQNIVRKMKFEKLITSKITSESDLGLDFASFLLRYFKNLGYNDFSEDANIQSLIKRAETFRAWADIEDLAVSYERLQE